MIPTELPFNFKEKFIFPVFPFLKTPRGKGIFYIILASFCFGEEMGILGIFAGIFALSAGILTIYLSIVGKGSSDEILEPTDLDVNEKESTPIVELN